MHRVFVTRLQLDTGLHIIKGANGVGKSVFLNTLIGFYGIAPKISRFDGSFAVTSYFNQDSYASSESAEWNLFLSREPIAQNQEACQRATQFLSKFGMSEVVPDLNIQLDPGRLSGGQLKKLGLIRTLLRPADLVLLDEPTNDLDQASVHILLECVQTLSRQVSVVVVTHDRALQALPHQDLHLFND